MKTIELIGEGLKSSLVEQIGFEKYNASVYLYVAAYLKSKGLDNLAKLFEEQHDEEQGHSLIIYKLLTDLSVDFEIPQIDGCNMPFNTISDVATLYLEREINTTDSLDEIKKQAMEENCPVVEERMRDMIELQQKEYEEATLFYDRAQLMGDDWFKVMLWDLSLK
jgi:ferritin